MKDNPSDPASLTTPHFEFYGAKLDYRILFPFGAVGAFRRVNDGSYSCSKFDSQCLLGIALGCSEFTNGMIFYNPILDSFCTSADFLIDKNRHIGEAFPSIRYDGGLTMSVMSNQDDGPLQYNVGESVFVQCQETFDILPATIKIPPTSRSKFYTIELEDGTTADVDEQVIYTEHTVPTSGEPTTSMGFFCPNWLKQGQKVTLLHDNIYKHGYLNLDKDNLWEFVTRDAEGRITSQIEIADLQYSWKMRMQENTFDVG